jgi:hypothetical protein
MKRIIVLWEKYSQPKYLFLLALIVYTALLYKNPFSQRTLIANLEPYPDTIHYIAPPRSLLEGRGFLITRKSAGFSPNVPPLYSLTLLPFYALNNDPRMFYFANVSLAFASLYLFYLIVKRITKDKWILGFSLFLFATNYYLYWYPTLAMAENLLLTVFLSGLLLLLKPVSKKTSILAGLVGLAFYATKYVAGPLSLIFIVSYLIKSLKSKSKSKRLFIGYFLTSVIVAIGLLIYYEYFYQRHSGVTLNLIRRVSGSVIGVAGVDAGRRGVQTNAWFSPVYFSDNIREYIKLLKGESTRFLWDYRPVMHKLLLVSGYLGLIYGVVKGKFRAVSISVIAMLLGQILFASVFYVSDARYVYNLIPTVLFGIPLFFLSVKEFLKKYRIVKYFPILVLLAFFAYSGLNFNALKKQVAINLRYSEVPWYYVSILRLNEYFTDERIDENKPFVITSLVPHYVDLFSNGNYELLPLTDQGPFWGQKHIVYGDHDYSDLLGLYEGLLEEGEQVYFASYGLGNEGYLHAAFRRIQEKFLIEEVFSGCHTQCKIYKLELKDV